MMKKLLGGAAALLVVGLFVWMMNPDPVVDSPPVEVVDPAPLPARTEMHLVPGAAWRMNIGPVQLSAESDATLILGLTYDARLARELRRSGSSSARVMLATANLCRWQLGWPRWSSV